MSKLIELTALYDSTIMSVDESKPAKVLIDVDAIQSVTKDSKPANSLARPKRAQVALHPSFASYGQNEHGDHAVSDQRILIVKESYEAIRSVLESERGVIVVQQIPGNFSVSLESEER